MVFALSVYRVGSDRRTPIVRTQLLQFHLEENALCVGKLLMKNWMSSWLALLRRMTCPIYQLCLLWLTMTAPVRLPTPANKHRGGKEPPITRNERSSTSSSLLTTSQPSGTRFIKKNGSPSVGPVDGCIDVLGDFSWRITCKILYFVPFSRPLQSTRWRENAPSTLMAPPKFGRFKAVRDKALTWTMKNKYATVRGQPKLSLIRVRMEEMARQGSPL